MAEIKRWSGNATTEISLYDGELTEMMEFIRQRERIFIFGNGKIGSAIGHYLKQSEVSIATNITSDNYYELKEAYSHYKSGIIIGVSDRFLPEVMPEIRRIMREEDIFILSSHKRESMGNTFSAQVVKDNFWINIYVTNRCNLNCRSCSAFAPVCSPDYYSLERLKKDLQRIKQMEFPSITVFKFTGGEPFLHNDIFEMFAYTRKLFPDIPMECYTNGLALSKFDADRLKRLNELGVTLVITEYPLDNLNLEHVYRRADKYGVSYCVIYSEEQKYFSKRPLNFHKGTEKHMFYYCPRYKMCDSVFLFNGRLYKCIYALSSSYFNQAFDKRLELLPEDYVDIEAATPAQVYQYCISRIPFCGYCSPIEELVPWGISEKKIEEWT